MSKHPGLNKKPGSWQEKERKKTGAKQSSRPKLRENPGHNKAIPANVPNSHPGLLLRTSEYIFLPTNTLPLTTVFKDLFIFKPINT